MRTLNISDNNNLNEIVFENRNKTYGAYVLRKGHDESVIKGFFISSFLLATLVLIPTLINKFKDAEVPPYIEPNFFEQNTIYTVNLEKPKTVVKVEKKQPAPDNPAPKNKNTAPVISDKPDDTQKDPVNPTDPVDAGNGKGADPNPNPNPDNTGGGGTGGDDNNGNENDIAIVVDYMPVFEGDLKKYLSKNISYPELAKEAGISGTVYISFVIDEEGNVTNVKLLRGIGGGCDEVALEAVKKMPKWKPGRNKANKPVRVLHNLPVKFTLAK